MTSNFGIQWLIVFALSLMVRLPYFLGNHFYFDGDEAIVGIMAQDLLNGNNIPVYFYGQQYGFSFFEVIATSICMIFFGSSIWTLKLGALLVFSVGSTFLFRLAFKKTNQFWWSVLIVLIVVQFPSWIIWASKDRGGYVTAYSLACILLYITQLKLCTIKNLVLGSMVLAILCHSQLLIGLPSIILFVYWVISAKKRNLIVFAPLLLIVFYFLFKMPAYLNPNYWPTPTLTHFGWNKFVLILREIPNVALGYSYYEMTFPMNWLVKIVGGMYFLLTVVGITYVFVETKSSIRTIFLLLAVGAIISFFLLGGMRFISFRYYLGFLTAVLFLSTLMLVEIIIHFRSLRKLIFVMVPLSFILSYTSKNIPDSWMLPSGNDQMLYGELVSVLKTRRVEGIYCTDPLLQWMLNYNGFSSRHTSQNERINRYVMKVDSCYLKEECTTAIVGYKGMSLDMATLEGWHNQVEYLNDKFFILMNPSPAFLTKGGFVLLK